MAFTDLLNQKMNKTEYRPVSTDSDGDDSLASAQAIAWARNAKRRGNMALLSSVVLFGASAVLLGAAGFRGHTDVECAVQLSTYSPALEAVEYIEYNIHNEQLTSNSEYRGHPTPELDQKWAGLWKVGAVDVPLDKIYLLNQTLDEGGSWRMSPPDKGNGVAGMVEVFHQLHCLDQVRRYTYLDTYEETPEDFRNSPDIRNYIAAA